MRELEKVDMAKVVAEARGAQAQLKLRVLANDCPRCSLGDPAFRACHFRGMDECKLQPAIERARGGALREQNLRVAGAPPNLWPHIVAGSLDRGYAAVVAARRLLAGHGKLVVLAGQAGNLKSSAACLVLAERGGMFLSAAMLAEWSKETTTAINRAREVSHLVLDDVGRGRSVSKPALEHAEELICARWDAGLPTVVTTNLYLTAFAGVDAPEFLDLFGGDSGRVADRLRADAIGAVACYDPSKRAPARDGRAMAAGGDR